MPARAVGALRTHLNFPAADLGCVQQFTGIQTWAHSAALHKRLVLQPVEEGSQ